MEGMKWYMGILDALFGKKNDASAYDDVVFEIVSPLVDEMQLFYMEVDKLAAKHGFTATEGIKRILHILFLFHTIAMEEFRASGKIRPGHEDTAEGTLMGSIITWFSIHIAHDKMSSQEKMDMGIAGRAGYHTFQNIRRTEGLGIGVANYLAKLMSASETLDDDAKQELLEAFQRSENRVARDTRAALAR